MITIPELASEALGSHLATHMGRRFGSTDAELVEIVQSAARLALDCIGNSDALYHNVEHTMMVTLCGYDILTGRRLLKDTNADDYAHVLIACLFHDIGYVRGILNDRLPRRLRYRRQRQQGRARARFDRRRAHAVSRRSVQAVRDASLCQVTNCSTPPVSPMPSSLRAFLPAVTTVVTKKACWYVPPISLANSAIHIICARPMRFITNLKKSE